MEEVKLENVRWIIGFSHRIIYDYFTRLRNIREIDLGSGRWVVMGRWKRKDEILTNNFIQLGEFTI